MMMSIKVILTLTTGLILCSLVSSYKILVITTVPVQSHHMLAKGAADILHERGHEVTFINCFKNEKPLYREISVAALSDKKNDTILQDINSRSQRYTVEFISRISVFSADIIMNHPEVKKLLDNKEAKFDLVVLEYFFNDPFIGFGVRFNCPVALISPVSMMSWLATLTGNPVSPAIIPNIFLPLPNNMNLLQRMHNTATAVYQEILGWWYLTPTQKSSYESLFAKESDIVPYEMLSSKIAIILVNSHPSFNVARPVLPNVIEVGGYHISEAKPLPEDLQKILDNAKSGVVYFSMGSNLKSSVMPKELIREILKSLSKLKQTVLWKFEEDLPNKPENVFISKWMPQDSVLAHPNVKLFITHGGLLSYTETVQHGVPILAIPVYGDQYHNAMGAVEREHGVVIQFKNLTEASLSWGLNEMLNNKKYEKNAKRLHRLYHDRPMKPRDLVSFYLEHAIRSGGAPHLSPPKLPHYSNLLLDVMALILMPPLMMVVFLIFIIKKCLKKTDKKKQKKI